MNIRPLHDKMVVEMPSSVAERNKTNLIQLIKRHDQIVCSKVIAVGPGKTKDNGETVTMEYAVGDEVYYPAECEKTSPRIKLDDGSEYLVILMEQVLCYKPHNITENMND